MLGLLAVLAAVGFVLAAPSLLDSTRHQAAIPVPPAGTGEVASVVAPPLETPSSPGHRGRAPALGPTESPAPGGASAAPSPSAPAPAPGIAPNERPSGGGISATPQPGVGENPGHDDDNGHGRPAKDKAHHQHHGHGNGHEHHGNGQGVGHSGDDDGQDNQKHDNGKHKGWTKPEKDPPPKADHSLGSGHGNGTKPDREHGQGSKHGKSGGRGHSHARSRR